MNKNDIMHKEAENTKKFIIEIELHTHDIDNNKIDTEQDIIEITDCINEFWNVKSLKIEEK